MSQQESTNKKVVRKSKDTVYVFILVLSILATLVSIILNFWELKNFYL